MTAERECTRKRLRRYAWVLSLLIAAALSVVLAASIAAASPIRAPDASLANARRPIARWALQGAPPAPVDDITSTLEDQATAIDVLANDGDEGALTITEVGTPAHGEAASDGPTVTYTPTLNYNGTDTFTYTACYALTPTECAGAVVTVTVEPDNDPPEAGDHTATTAEDTQIVISLAHLVTDVETHDPDLAYLIVAGPDHGGLTAPSMVVTYTPAADWNGTDVFSYTVTDRGDPDGCGEPGPDCDEVLTSTARAVTITVTPVNDAPSFTAGSDQTVEEDASLQTVPGWATDISAGPPDEAGQTLVFDATNDNLALFSTPPAISPEGTLTYEPAPDGYGTATVSVSLHDDGGTANGGLDTSLTQTLAITVTAVNDAPLAAGDPVTTAEDIPVTVDVLANDTDPDGDALSVTQASGATHGTVITTSTAVTYTPAANYNGGDVFTYTVSDGLGGVASAPVTVTIYPVNDVPVAGDGTETTDEDESLTIDLGALVSDLESVPGEMAYAIVSSPAHGSLAGSGRTRTYTPEQDYYGPDSFSYEVTDCGDPDNCGLPGATCAQVETSDPATVTITINPLNDAPVAVGDEVTTSEDITVTVSVLENDTDVDGDLLTVTQVTAPAHGVAVSDGQVVTYTSGLNYYGGDLFGYTISDGHGGIASAPVTVTVTPVNDPPELPSLDDRIVDEETELTFTVVASDADLPTDTLTYSLAGAPPEGADINPTTGAFSWTPAETQGPGTYTLTVRVTDAAALYDEEDLCVTVSEANLAPVLDPVGNQTVDEWATLAFTATATDMDVPSNTLTFSLTGTPPSGASIGPSSGVFGWTPVEADGPGDYDFGVQVSDGLLTDSETISVHVNPVNEPPAATDGSASTDEDTAVTIDLGAWASDAETAVGDLTYSIGTGPGHGTLAGSGQLRVYTPTADYYGPDSLTYYVTDRGDPDGCSGPGGECAPAESSLTATVSITIDPVNDPPVASDDNYEVDEDLVLVVGAPGVLGNDSNVGDGDVLMAALVGNPTHGTVALDSDGSFAYSSDPEYFGTDSFTYRAQDGVFVSNLATVTINVRPVNDAPVAMADAYATDEDEVLVVAASEGVLDNDNDVDSAVLTATAVGAPLHGDLSLQADGSFVYTPTANYNGADRFTYQASDGTAHSGVVTVTLAVAPVNDAPMGHDDDYSTDEDAVLSVGAPGVLGNDTDVDGDVLTATLVAGVLNGELALDGDGSFVYTPSLEYNGADFFSYRATDGLTTSNLVIVTINVGMLNDPPVAANDSYTTTEDATLTVSDPAEGVLANDTDAEGYPLTADLVGQPAHGTVTLEIDGTFVYTPTANYHGGDAFTYQARDDAANSNLATVSITVTQVNDAPVALDDTHSTNEDSALSVGAPGVLGNDTDIDGDGLTATVVSLPVTGTLDLEANGAFVYTPADDYAGQVSYVYQASDGHGGADVATVTITVNPVNDAPVAVGDVVTATEDILRVIDVLANDYDVEGDPLDFYLGSAAHGTVVKSDEEKTVTYAPSSNYYGLDGFSYFLLDGHGGTASGVVTITVEAVNDPPVTAGDAVTTPEDTPVTVDVLANDVPGPANESTQALTVTAVTVPAHGSAVVNPDGTVTYSPSQDYYGPDSLICTVCDDGDPSECASGTVDVTVNPLNDAPVASDDAYSTDEDEVLTRNAALGVLGNDADVDGPSVAAILVDDVEHGALDLRADGSFVYAPAANYNGADAFTYRASDGELESALATVSLTVNPVNDAPVAVDDTASTVAGNPVTIDVLANDSDVDGDVLTIYDLGAPSQGVADIVGGMVRYTPGPAFSGDVFTYTVSDGQGGHDTAHVAVSVGNPCYLPLVLRPVTCGAYEPNDTIGSAWGPLESGRTYRAMLCSPDDVDLYYFELDEPHRIVADLTGIPAGADYDLSLWRLVDGTPKKLAQSIKLGNADEHIDCYNASLEDVWLYLQVNSASGSSSTQAYSLRVTYE